MISFYKDEVGVAMYRDDTYFQTMLCVIERPATEQDAAENPDEQASFVAASMPIPLASPDGVA